MTTVRQGNHLPHPRSRQNGSSKLEEIIDDTSSPLSPKHNPRPLNMQDLLKFIAFVLMVIDHSSFYLFDNYYMGRAIGRGAMPFYLFFAGWNSPYPSISLTTFLQYFGWLVPLTFAHYSWERRLPLDVLATVLSGRIFAAYLAPRQITSSSSTKIKHSSSSPSSPPLPPRYKYPVAVTLCLCWLIFFVHNKGWRILDYDISGIAFVYIGSFCRSAVMECQASTPVIASSTSKTKHLSPSSSSSSPVVFPSNFASSWSYLLTAFLCYIILYIAHIQWQQMIFFFSGTKYLVSLIALISPGLTIFLFILYHAPVPPSSLPSLSFPTALLLSLRRVLPFASSPSLTSSFSLPFSFPSYFFSPLVLLLQFPSLYPMLAYAGHLIPTLAYRYYFKREDFFYY